MLMFEELHAAVAVMFCVVPSLKLPLAVNCVLPPAEIVVEDGERKIEVKVALVTVSPVVPVTFPEIALMFVEPLATAVASPGLDWPELSIVAAPVDDELHVTAAVKFFVVPSL
jgi:hypothetical protein